MSCALLALPRELRDQIFEDVIYTRWPSPPYDRSNLGRAQIETDEYLSWRGLKSIMFEEEQPVATAAGLLRANRQLREEAGEILRRMTQESRAHALDIMFVEERELWPTWLFVPTKSHDVETVEVSLWIVGAMKAFGAGYSPSMT